MSFTQAEVARLSIVFPQEHGDQVLAKAKKYGLSFEDAKQETSVLCLELGPKYDQSKGSLCGYLLGHLDKRLRRQLGPHRFAVSLDSEDLDDSVRGQIENTAVLKEDVIPDLQEWHPPGAKKLSSLANFVSGKSTSDLSRALGVTPRRIRQILQQLREEEGKSPQFELGLEETC